MNAIKQFFEDAILKPLHMDDQIQAQQTQETMVTEVVPDVTATGESEAKTQEEAVRQADEAKGEDRSAFNCPDCAGEGLKDAYTVCPRCKGTGKV